MEGDRKKCIAKSVFDRELVQRHCGAALKSFLHGGWRFFYLREEDIRSLFLDLIEEFPGSQIMFEVYSKFMLRLRNGTIKKQQRNASSILARAQWAAGSSASIVKWSDKIRVVDDFPYYSRVDMERHWDKKVLFPLKVIRIFNGVRMVRLALG